MAILKPVFLPEVESSRGKEYDLIKALDLFIEDVSAVLDRGLQFEDNIDCRLVSFTSNATPDTEDEVAHTLGKTPQGYVVYGKDKAGDLYTSTGGTAWDATNMYLKCTVASVAYKIIVF